MTCAEARDSVLIADLAELVPGGSSDLGSHLSTCEACRALAAQVLATEDALRAERAVPPRRSAADAAARAAAAARRTRRNRRRVLWAAGPALAAALVVAALVARREPYLAPIAPVTAAPTLPPLVQQSTGDVAIVTTANPNIVVVWQF